MQVGACRTARTDDDEWLTRRRPMRYVSPMATRPQDKPDASSGASDEAKHDAFVRAKVRRGLAESRNRAAMIPLEQAWRDLTGER